MTTRVLPSPRQALLAVAGAAAVALACAGLIFAAALAPAPPAVLPLVAFVCILCPVTAAWDIPPALAVLRFSRELAGLPEVEHPLGR